MWFDFYDRHGRPYAYADDGVHIYKYSGKPIAYIAGQSVYSYPGRHVGFFEDGMILDHRGDAILFTKLASGEPARPAKQFRNRSNWQGQRRALRQRVRRAPPEPENGPAESPPTCSNEVARQQVFPTKVSLST